MSFCATCHARLQGRGASCPRCDGATLRCGSCDAANAPGATFCEQCGLRIAPRGAGVADAASFRRERKLLTILFADVTGSLALIAGSDPEAASDLLERMVAIMADAVHQFDGTLIRVQGDGIMAVFGAPRADRNHAVNASYAADRMLAEVRAFSAERSAAEVPLQIRVGLHSGEVIAHPVASDVTTLYDVTGETVHIAARMEQSAQPGTALLTDATLRLARGLVQATPAGEILVKGLQGAIPCWRLDGMQPVALPPRMLPREHPMLPFHGRSRELRRLLDHADIVAAGATRLARIRGEPGCGKSRLAAEFADRMADQGWGVLRCAVPPHPELGGSAIALLVAQAIGLSSEPQDGVALADRLVALLGKAGEEHAAPVAALLDTAPVTPTAAAPDWEGASPVERRARIGAALIAIFRQLARSRPTLLVVEDAHFLNERGATYLDTILAGDPRASLMVLVTTLADRAIEHLAATPHCEVTLGALGRTEFQALCNDLLEPAQEGPLANHLWSATRGNPLYLEHYLSALHERGVLGRTAQRYAALTALPEVKVPTSLRSLLAERVDRLTDLGKDTLQAASVLGLRFDTAHVSAVMGLPDGHLRQVLRQLVASGLVQAGPPGSREFRFAHGLAREAVYDSLPRRSRTALHRAFLSLLEESGKRAPSLLAEHAVRGERWDKAVGYLRTAGRLAFEADAKLEALRIWRAALAAAAELEGPRDRQETELDLRLDLRDPLFQLARIDELRAELALAAGLVTATTDPQRAGRYFAVSSHLHWFSGEPDQALRAAETAMEVGRRSEDEALQTRAHFQIGLVLLTHGALDQCIDAMQRVSARTEPLIRGPYGLNLSLAVTARCYVARAEVELGRLAAGRRSLAAAGRLLGKAKEPFARLFLHIGRGHLEVRSGNPARAIVWLERACRLSEAAEAPLLRPVAMGYLAEALLAVGRKKEALDTARAAVGRAEAMGFKASQPYRLAVLARALLANGLSADGARTAQDAFDQACRQSEPAARSMALDLLPQSARPDARGALTH